jgi:hypothetical protein
MLRKVISTGFNLYTLPARMIYRRAAVRFDLPRDLDALMRELRVNSAQVAREVRAVLDGVDAEMRAKTADLSPAERRQAADIALYAAERHLSMAAVNVLRAVWLVSNAVPDADPRRTGGGAVIDRDPE